MSDDPFYQRLKWVAIILAVVWLGWHFVGAIVRPNLDPATAAYARAVRDFNDGHYEKALRKYEEVVLLDAENTAALRGQADVFSRLGDYQKAISIYDSLIARESTIGVNYVNRGIAHDHQGDYEQAIKDYEKAYELNEALDRGPGWFTRFLRNQPNKPPTIIARARYLRAQLSLPPAEQVLRKPEEDKKQKPYSQR